jgi:hypothetical protein
MRRRCGITINICEWASQLPAERATAPPAGGQLAQSCTGFELLFTSSAPGFSPPCLLPAPGHLYCPSNTPQAAGPCGSSLRQQRTHFLVVAPVAVQLVVKRFRVRLASPELLVRAVPRLLLIQPPFIRKGLLEFLVTSSL